MAKDQTEGKKLPASKKKLQDARKKGQVARSKDLTSGFALAGSLGLLLVFGGSMITTAETMFDKAGDVAAGDLAVGLAAIGATVRSAVLHIPAPFYLIGPVLVVLSAMVMLRGIPFSIDPVTPKFENINPAEGFKRLFKLKSLLELVKSVLKVLLLGTTVLLVLAAGLRALVLVPACGFGCVPGVFHSLVTPLFATSCLLFVVTGLLDVGLQRWLFLREQKMSITEAKRERKDMDGDPLLRRERRRLIREAARMPVGLGLKRANLVLHDGRGIVVGLRYKLNETPVPLVVCRGLGERGAELLAQAAELELAMVQEPELAADLAKRVVPGNIIPEDTYRSVAQALARARLV